MNDSAVHLRRVIKQLEASALANQVRITDITDSLFKIEKLTGESGSRTDFSFTIRKEVHTSGERWWPVVYISQSGSELRAETHVNGRILTNIHMQNELVALAESWAKALEAQAVTKTVKNVLL